MWLIVRKEKLIKMKKFNNIKLWMVEAVKRDGHNMTYKAWQHNQKTNEMDFEGNFDIETLNEWASDKELRSVGTNKHQHPIFIYVDRPKQADKLAAAEELLYEGS